MRVLFPIRYAEHPHVEVSDWGHAVTPDVVRVGPLGLLVEIGDVLLVAGVPREVVAVDTPPAAGGPREPDVVHLQHRPTARPFVRQLVEG